MMTMGWDEMVDTSARLLHEAKVLDALLSEAHASGSAPLPAPALTEQAIVDALKADPAMAGRVVVLMCQDLSTNDVRTFQEAAQGMHFKPGLQRLAVALAAASYRG